MTRGAETFSKFEFERRARTAVHRVTAGMIDSFRLTRLTFAVRDVLHS
jgi:hypothetical protein